MRWLRRFSALVVTLTAAASLVACGDEDDAEDELRAAIRATERLAFKYVYEEQADHRGIEVRGLVEDDFRYKAQLAIDGTPAYEEVVSDDVVAARLLDPSALGLFVREELAGHSADDDFEEGATALQQQRWVIDKTGAPSLLQSSRTERVAGDDWIVDSLTVFDYLEQTMRVQPVVRFNREALDYREREDPFPHPAGGVIRYDVRPIDLPRRSEGSGGNQATLGPIHFRKISVYVEEGRIVEVREAIDIANRLDELERNFDVKFPEDRSVAENVVVAVDGINVVRTGQGEDPLRVRTMRLRLTDIGDDTQVALPTGDTVDATLAFLKNRGFGADDADAGDADEGDAGEGDAGEGDAGEGDAGEGDADSPDDGADAEETGEADSAGGTTP